MEKVESGNVAEPRGLRHVSDTKCLPHWKDRIEKEFADIAKERSDVEAFWQRIGKLDKVIKGVEIKEGGYRHRGMLKKIKEKILPAKKTADDKRQRLAEIQREKIALEKKKEELRRKRGELAKKRGMLI